jgi:hypothetical protein
MNLDSYCNFLLQINISNSDILSFLLYVSGNIVTTTIVVVVVIIITVEQMKLLLSDNGVKFCNLNTAAPLWTHIFP